MADQIRFYTDEHIDRAVARALRERGADVVRCVEVTTLGTQDPRHFDRAISERRAIITRDHDFLRLAAGGRPHWGILFVIPRSGLQRVIRRVLAIFEQRTADSMRNRVEYL